MALVKRTSGSGSARNNKGGGLIPVAFPASWMATRTTSHTPTTMSQRPETIVNFNQKAPRKRKAQEPGAQEEQPASKRRKQVRVFTVTSLE